MAVPDQTIRELTALAGVVLGQDDLEGTLVELCRIAVRAVPCADGASITTLRDGQPTAMADGPWAREFDELQYAEHEGPCFDAFRTGSLFRLPDLTTEQRWPSWVPRAVERGARSVVSLPLMSQGLCIGALNLYAREADIFSAEEVSVAEIIAGHASLASQVAVAFFGHRDLAEQLAEAMHSRATIEQAKGILMAMRRCGPDEAFETLVQLSQSSNRKLREVAATLVDDVGGPPA